MTGTCQQGDVRLVGDQSLNEGRVEVCLNDTWGTIRSLSYSTRRVICRQLGYSSDGKVKYSIVVNYSSD